MSELLDSVEDPDSLADHGMFGICDEAAIERDALQSLVPKGDQWLSVGDAALLIGVEVDGLGIAVRLEHWDTEPPPARDSEVTQTATLHLPTGNLVYDAIAGGPEFDFFTVPPGRYKVRVSGWGRSDVAEKYDALLDLDREEADLAIEALGGHERYLLQFWPEPSLPGQQG
ncbi:hypothetical protein AB0B45_50745 [Nonomuraea sp. NPDC049152]|uniref:hypothetical protein n=1 Tax=Nonomuraea sp. NPDC049152 TaxID=3154350 RepID=UPI003410D31B